MTTFNLSSVSREVITGLCDKKFILVGFNRDQSRALATAFRELKSRTRTLEPVDVDPGAQILLLGDLILLNTDADLQRTGWSDPTRIEKCSRPVLLVGAKERLRQHAFTADESTCGFVVAPFAIEDVFRRAHTLLVETREIAFRRGIVNQSNYRVLIADDDPSIPSLLATILKNFKIDCTLASNGIEALAYARSTMPDLVLLDVNMPMLSGFDVLTSLRSDPSTNAVRIIILTASGEQQSVLKGIKLGADDYIVKPFSPIEIASRVKKVLRKSVEAA